VNFVRRLRNQSGTARRLDNRTETLASGSILSGTVGGFGGDNLELLLVGVLVAVVSGLPIEALKPAALDKADRLFGVIFAEAQQASNMVNAAAKYFELN
jgi:hypothetical protein